MADIKRQIAYKARAKDILEGNYVKEEGEWAPNYVIVNQQKVSRANIIGVIVSKTLDQNFENVLIDDGSARLSVRAFDNEILANVGVGDIVLLVGRPREFGNERYVVPEIVKRLDDKRWVEVRRLELEKGNEKDIKQNKEESVETNEEMDNLTVMIDFIKKNDPGEGVEIEDIIQKSSLQGAEQIISTLLERGEIFEIRPGRVKTLE